MDNLFILRSPLQIINALEAIEYFHLKNNNTNIQAYRFL